MAWLYPPACIACKVALPVNGGEFYICARCRPLFAAVPAPFCKKCGQPLGDGGEGCAACFGKSFHFESNESAFVYDALMRELLHDLKFRNKKRIATGLGRLWAERIALPDSEFSLTWLPMHRKKRRERGFDQAEIMACEIAARLGCPVAKMLSREADTPPQSGLHPKLRAENVSGAFEIANGAAVAGRSVVIIDDIFTTGASINECAKILMDGGAKAVYARTLAVALKKREGGKNSR